MNSFVSQHKAGAIADLTLRPDDTFSICMSREDWAAVVRSIHAKPGSPGAEFVDMLNSACWASRDPGSAVSLGWVPREGENHG